MTDKELIAEAEAWIARPWSVAKMRAAKFIVIRLLCETCRLAAALEEREMECERLQAMLGSATLSGSGALLRADSNGQPSGRGN